MSLRISITNSISMRIIKGGTERRKVEKCVFLPHSDFKSLKENPYQEYEAITGANDLMYEDKEAYHFIMLLDEYGEDE